jgi:hypothetical protein
MLAGLGWHWEVPNICVPEWSRSSVCFRVSGMGRTWEYADRSTYVEVELPPGGVASVSVRFHTH